MILPVAFAALEIASPGCPDPARVEAHVRALLPVGGAQAVTARVTIATGPGGLRIALQGETVGRAFEREIPAASSCDERAEAAAVVVATWLAELHPELLEAPVVARPPSAPPPPRMVRARAAAPASAAPLALSAGVGGGAAFTGADGAAAAGLVAHAAAFRGALGAGLALAGAGPRTVSVAAGEARWLRLSGALGPRQRLGRGAIALELRQELALAWVRAQGRALDAPRADAAFGLGAGGGARLLLRVGALSPWIDLGVARFFAPGRVRITYLPDGERATAPLPRWQALVALGVGVGRGDR